MTKLLITFSIIFSFALGYVYGHKHGQVSAINALPKGTVTPYFHKF